MAEVMDKLEADIPIFFKARKKFYSCPNMVTFYYIGYCKLFNYTFDTSWDMLHHCSSCKANKADPVIKRKVRSP